jgi:hypothetical protein
VIFIDVHDDKKIKTTIKPNLFLKISISTPLYYLKKPDHAGSLTAPFFAGNLNFTPLKVTPESNPIPFSVIA